MPLYEYICPSCGAEWEQLVGYRAPSPPCPDCEGEEVTRKVSLSAFHLKGGGWYTDAYKGKDNVPPAPGGKAAAADSPAGSGDAAAPPAAAAPASDSAPKAPAPAPAAAPSSTPSSSSSSND